MIIHKTCLKCAHCNMPLTLGKYASLDGKFYCKPHFKQLFMEKVFVRELSVSKALPY